jgi:crotonobetaine/carnitine-CoA ligase
MAAWNIVANRNLRKLLEEKVLDTPDKTFLVFEDVQGRVEAFTYREFNDNVNRVANWLLRAGVGKADKVNLHLRNCPEFLFGWFALAKIGAVMVPTNPLLTAPELQYVLSHSESVLSITEPDYINTVQSVVSGCPALKHVILCRIREQLPGTTLMSDILGEDATSPPDALLSPHDDMAILYTSGTTARPKGVIQTHAYYVWIGELVAHHLRLRPDDRSLIVLPLFHSNAQLYSTMASLVAGASIALMQTFSASRYFDQVARYEATASSVFAAPIRMILNQPSTKEAKGNKLREVLFAQNVTPEQLQAFEKTAGAPLVQLYGLTERSLPMCNPVYGARDSMSIGRPTLGAEVKVVDDSGSEVVPGSVGELIIKGVPGWTLMKGYFKNPEATAAAIRDGWFYTGDNVRIGDNGFFYFVDRKKDMIKRAGENVSPAEVEGVVNEHPKVLESAAIGVPDETRDEAIKVFVTLKEGETATQEEILEHCRQRLMRLKLPSYIEFIKELPKTPVGKIQKHLLRNKK